MIYFTEHTLQISLFASTTWRLLHSNNNFNYEAARCVAALNAELQAKINPRKAGRRKKRVKS